MTRIEKAFQNKRAFIPFITVGDPTLDVTKEIIIRMEEEGADLIELGIPFSDPIAEGAVIQAANERALANGVTTDHIFDMVKELRETVQIPLVFLLYYNQVFTYGIKRFLENCKNAGVDGLIIPDLPYEEKQEIDKLSEEYGVDLISLIAPTSHDRIAMIAKEARGFVYCISSLGVTGVRTEIQTDLQTMISLVKKENDIPCAVGFGIATKAQAKEMASVADGAIVGSAIVKMIEEHGENAVPYVAEYVREMKKAVDEAYKEVCMG